MKNVTSFIVLCLLCLSFIPITNLKTYFGFAQDEAFECTFDADCGDGYFCDNGNCEVDKNANLREYNYAEPIPSLSVPPTVPSLTPVPTLSVPPTVPSLTPVPTLSVPPTVPSLTPIPTLSVPPTTPTPSPSPSCSCGAGSCSLSSVANSDSEIPSILMEEISNSVRTLLREKSDLGKNTSIRIRMSKNLDKPISDGSVVKDAYYDEKDGLIKVKFGNLKSGKKSKDFNKEVWLNFQTVPACGNACVADVDCGSSCLKCNTVSNTCERKPSTICISDADCPDVGGIDYYCSSCKCKPRNKACETNPPVKVTAMVICWANGTSKVVTKNANSVTCKNAGCECALSGKIGNCKTKTDNILKASCSISAGNAGGGAFDQKPYSTCVCDDLVAPPQPSPPPPSCEGQDMNDVFGNPSFSELSCGKFVENPDGTLSVQIVKTIQHRNQVCKNPGNRCGSGGWCNSTETEIIFDCPEGSEPISKTGKVCTCLGVPPL